MSGSAISLETFQHAMGAFLESMGLPGTPPAGSTLSITLGDILVHIDHDPQRAEPVMWSYLSRDGDAPIPSTAFRSLMETGFLLMFKQGAAIVFNRDADAFMLTEPVGSGDLAPERLENRLQGFVAAWRLARSRIETATATTTENAVMPDTRYEESRFIRP